MGCNQSFSTSTNAFNTTYVKSEPPTNIYGKTAKMAPFDNEDDTGTMNKKVTMIINKNKMPIINKYLIRR
ncbi:hypothetical protein OXYTRIMIC_561 [Oxytricha trifallax]|uniref:Uncharacterized protein n=1 Tax=Oxytricha trifallax TaxID=1172189 RepID=A0A073I0F4_9SPIT|nr:hypothetical protein OXYTRIMIC_561 [Oxytricha trifallax]